MVFSDRGTSHRLIRSFFCQVPHRSKFNRINNLTFPFFLPSIFFLLSGTSFLSILCMRLYFYIFSMRHTITSYSFCMRHISSCKPPGLVVGVKVCRGVYPLYRSFGTMEMRMILILTYIRKAAWYRSPERAP